MFEQSPRCTLTDGPHKGRQLAFYDLNDDRWLPLMLKHLAAGGCVIVERTGTLIIMPGPPEGT